MYKIVGLIYKVDLVSYWTGGWDGTTHLNTGECYDPITDKWSFISPALTARWDAGVAVDSEKLYLVGGCDRNAVCTLETECYNTESDTWSKVASLPVATHGLKCCTIQLPNKFVWDVGLLCWLIEDDSRSMVAFLPVCNWMNRLKHLNESFLSGCI